MVVNTLASLSSTRYLGPIYDSKKEGRVTIPLVSNETASFYPSMFYDQDKKGPCIRSIQELYSKVMPTLNLKSDEAFFQRLEVEIQDHAENRLQLIFQQFLMVYKTNLHFSLNEKAQHQAGLKHKQSLSIKLEEAHSSTLPCLLLDKDNTQYVFGSDTFFYYAQNMTVKLPKEVNSLDSWIDTTSQEFNDESLRDAAGHLIRHVSTNLENPNGALKLFVRNFLWRLEKFQSTNPNTIQRLISRFYEKVASSYEIQLERSDLLVKTLCFERCSTESLDESFFQNVQKTLHKSFHKDLRVAERREKLVLERPISDTQNTYAKVYLISPTIISLLSAYFSETLAKSRDLLLNDWKFVVHITPAKQQGISSELTQIANETKKKIQEIYQVQKPQHFGSIIAAMLHHASALLNPDVNALYSSPEAANRGAITRAVSQAMVLQTPSASQHLLRCFQENLNEPTQAIIKTFSFVLPHMFNAVQKQVNQ